MPLWIILDLTVLIIYILAVLFFRTKGFLKASETVISLVLTFCLMSSVLPIFQGVITESRLGEIIDERVNEALVGASSEDGENESGIALPDFMQNSMQKQLDSLDEAKNNMMQATADGTTAVIIKVLSAILLFILIKIGIFLLFRILEIFFRLKPLKFMNRTLGIVLGLVNATVIVYILCAAAAVFVPAELSYTFKNAMEESLVAGFFYNNNFIVNLFL